jgi:hypothetical protein
MCNHKAQAGRIMIDIPTDHGTVVVEQILNVPLSRAYGAFTDPKERARWGAPSDTAAFIYDAARRTIRDPDKLLAANITTLEFMPHGQGTRLKVTVQVTSFAGVSMIQNTKAGHEGSLAGMARYLER